MSQGNLAENPQQGTQVVHVKGDSDLDMEALFSVLKNGNQGQVATQNSYKNRNLPSSFFTPPDPLRMSHSRENSQDSTAPPVLSISHVRSRSSPAQLPHTLSAAHPPPSHHMKQASVDMLGEEGHGVIPQGSWDIHKGLNNTGLNQRYFTNPVEPGLGGWANQGLPGAAGVVGPPKSNSTTALNHVQTSRVAALSPNQSQHTSPNVSMQNLGNLPHGWEQGITPDGEIYFINHIERTTSWYDPRVPKHLQRPGPMKLGLGAAQQPSQTGLPTLPQPPQLQQLPTQLQPPQQQQQQQQQQPPVSMAQAVVTSQASSSPAPPQNSTITPVSQQAAVSLAQQAVSAASTTQSGGSVPTGRPPLPNAQFIQGELVRLQREKDRLRREQDEIVNRERMLKDMMTPVGASSGGDGQPPTSGNVQQGVMQPLTSSGMDPFLGQAGAVLESHARQNSGDSGLGGMGTSYSLPRTPEDFLTTVDDMDTSDVNKLVKIHNSDFNMNDLQAHSVSMEMGNLDVNDPSSGMDSDDLVPSLQGDISDLSNELLNDVQKMDNLLWL